MIHSRPGFTTVVTNDGPELKGPAPAKLAKDMIPAINTRDQPVSNAPGMGVKPLQKPLPSVSAEVPPEVARLLPEIIANPNPSPTPQLTSPHEE